MVKVSCFCKGFMWSGRFAVKTAHRQHCQHRASVLSWVLPKRFRFCHMNLSL